PWVGGSTYAVAVIVPISCSSPLFTDAPEPAAAGASLALWIVSSRPRTSGSPGVLTTKSSSRLKRRSRSKKLPLNTNVKGICLNPASSVEPAEEPDLLEEEPPLDPPAPLTIEEKSTCV